MNRRERELLNKQFRWLDPVPQGAGSVMLVIVAIFFIGLAIGMFVPHATP